MSKILVIGGGISGLSSVHYLKRFSKIANKSVSEITLLESNEAIGGCIQTKRHDDGVIHELGPRSIRFINGSAAANTLSLIDQIGMGESLSLVDSKSKAATSRYIYTNGVLNKAPSGIFSLLSCIPGTKIRLYKALLKDLSTPKMDITQFEGHDPSAYEFAKYRFGEEIAEYFLDPLMRGITSGDCRKLSARSNFAIYFDREQEHGSVIGGMLKPSSKEPEFDSELMSDRNNSYSLRSVISKRVSTYNLKNGLQSLTETLTDSIMSKNNTHTNIQMYNQTPVEKITYHPNEGWDVVVKTIDNSNVTLKADHIFATIPSKYLANILHMDTEINKEALDYIMTNLKGTPFAPVACVCLEYRGIRGGLPKETQSFGFLTQSNSGSKLLGISFDSEVIPEHDNGKDVFRMTAMIGGAWFKEILGTEDANLVPDEKYTAIALDEIKKILNITAEPHRVTVKVWKDGIAQYTLGHEARVDSVRRVIEQISLPITLLGQSYDGISINDVIYASRQNAFKFVKNLPTI